MQWLVAHVNRVYMQRKSIPTDWWSTAWHKTLTNRQRLLWRYLWEKCDPVGMFAPLWQDEMAFHLGCTTDELLEDIAFLEDGELVAHLDGGELILPGFLLIQYGRLSRNSRAHYHVIYRLERQFGDDIAAGWGLAGLPEYAMPDIIGE